MNEENAGKRIISTSGHYAYLKISEGCDNHCTYCIIPKLRGKHRSRTMESLVEETKQLAEAGVKELLVVAQDTSIYGRDIYGKPMLHELLKKLCAVRGNRVDKAVVLLCRNSYGRNYTGNGGRG